RRVSAEYGGDCDFADRVAVEYDRYRGAGAGVVALRIGCGGARAGRVCVHFDFLVRDVHKPIHRDAPAGAGARFGVAVNGERTVRYLDYEAALRRRRVSRPVALARTGRDRDVRFRFAVGECDGHLRSRVPRGWEDAPEFFGQNVEG